MSCKIVMIGGGSYSWTPHLAKDLFLRESLDGSELVLVDIVPEAANDLRRYCELIAERIGCRWKIAVADIEDALTGADYVCVTISTGGLAAMDLDYRIPEEFGIYHTVADTVGPGGISRTLRNVPVFVEFARKMERLCPDAWMIHVTNPLTQLTRAVCKTSSIKCVGLCHGFSGSMSFLAQYFGVDYEDVDALCVGVNHYTWLKHITCKGRPAAHRLSMKQYLEYEEKKEGPLVTGTTDDEIDKALGMCEGLHRYLSFELFERFGVFPTLSCAHHAENLSFYLNDWDCIRKHRIRRKGVLPCRKDGYAEAQQKIRDIVSGKREPDELKLSRETFSEILESLHTGRASRVIVAMPNEGQVSNLPKDVVVETWAMASASGVFPVLSGPVPHPLAGMMQLIVDEQECSVEAALTGDRRKVVQALAVSPMVQNKDCVEELADRILAAHKDLLPQFK